MTWYILSILLVILYFVSLQGASVSPKRQIYKQVSLVVSILAVGLNWGVMLGSWIGVLIYLTVALEAYHHLSLRLTDIMVRILFCFLLMLGLTFEVDVATALVFIPVAIMMTLALYQERASFYVVILLSFAIIVSLFFLLASYGSVVWLNPSFILPETIIPADIFYLDHAALYISVTLLICLACLSLSLPPSGSVDTVNIIVATLLLSAVPASLAENMNSVYLTFACLLVLLPLVLTFTRAENSKVRLMDKCITIGLILLAFASGGDGSLIALYVFALAALLVSQVVQNYPYMDKYRGLSQIFKNLLMLIVIFHLSTSTSLNLLALGLITICLYDLIKILNLTLVLSKHCQERG